MHDCNIVLAPIKMLEIEITEEKETVRQRRNVHMTTRLIRMMEVPVSLCSSLVHAIVKMTSAQWSKLV
jgi:hypothetical protein